ncbi:hypothetical protein Y032_0023g780 [Ancylostoma ceylanicum]|uniref:Uncharacterized protein n=1 Tax=Ancylostoma ceylanicum TaxID=53326 RepID=A0A016UXK0_9BILA|nr:hypothetical protein Y032_0023g780 [Ancylostoma ceylanicum]
MYRVLQLCRKLQDFDKDCACFPVECSTVSFNYLSDHVNIIGTQMIRNNGNCPKTLAFTGPVQCLEAAE